MDTEKLLIAERAAEWLEQLKQAGPEERAQFVKWLKESPQHGWEILLAKSTDIVLRQLLKDAGIDVNTIQEASNVRWIDGTVLPEGSSSAALRTLPSHSSKFSWKAPVVVCFLALISLMMVTIYAVSDRFIRTDAGEWHTTRLADGTILRAGPRTRAWIDFTDDERVIRFAHGELMLHVAKDRARPLLVKTDLATARAVGTAFAVRHMERDRVSITVKEGIVAVSRELASKVSEHTPPVAAQAVTLSAGEQVQVTNGHRPLTVTQVNLEKELAWTSGRLIFDDETTAEAVQELNLRNEVQLKIQSPELAARPIRGVMRANDPMSFAQLLEGIAGVSVLDDRRGTLLLTLHPNGGEIGPQETEDDF